MASAIRRLSNAMTIGRRSVKKYTVNTLIAEVEANEKKNQKAEDDTLILEDRCILKVGYLVKSPSQRCLRNKIARWHLRWFVLYDTQPHSDVDATVERKIELLYYRNHQEQQKNCQPLGRVNLRDAKIYAQAGSLHGYQYVINVVTETRCIHLCATQSIVYEEWFEKLRSHLDDPDYQDKISNEVDDGYATWDKSNNPQFIRDLIKKDGSKKKKKKSSSRTNMFEDVNNLGISSPTQIVNEPFKNASSFFEPTNEVVDLKLPRRARSNTVEETPEGRRGRGYSLEQRSDGLATKLDTKCIVHDGYLTKSPPLHKVKSRVARWHLRFFVLYDTSQRSDDDDQHNTAREVELLYFKNRDSFQASDQPLGRINLTGAMVYPCRQHSVHGFPNVFVVDVVGRKYYLCSTNEYVSNEWQQKLLLHCPKRRSDSGIEWDGPSTTGRVRHDTLTRQLTDPHIRYFNPYEFEVQPQPPTFPPQVRATNHYDESPFSISTIGLFPGRTSPRETEEQFDEILAEDILNLDEIVEGEDDPDVGIISTHRKIKISESMYPNFDIGDDSDTEESGISRTSSDSSTTNTLPSIRQTPPRPPPYIPKEFRRAPRPTSDDCGFFGPKLFITSRSSQLLDEGDKNNNQNLLCGDNALPNRVSLRHKPSLNRVQSKSLDSIHVNMNMSLFDEDESIDELFPKLDFSEINIKDKNTEESS